METLAREIRRAELACCDGRTGPEGSRPPV